MATLDATLLRDLPPLAGIEEEGLRRLLSEARSQHFSKGSHIFEQGERSGHFFLLLDGHVRVVKTSSQDEHIIVRYISSGELLGIAVAMGMPVYPANAVAARDCVVLAWPNSVWQSTIGRWPSFASNTYQTVGERLLDIQERVMEMATERVEQRVAGAVLKLARQTGRRTDAGIQIDFPISRQDMSETTGTTLHTVSRLLSAWEQDGVVKSGRQMITVTKDDQLTLLAERNRGEE